MPHSSPESHTGPTRHRGVDTLSSVPPIRARGRPETRHSWCSGELTTSDLSIILTLHYSIQLPVMFLNFGGQPIAGYYLFWHRRYDMSLRDPINNQ